MMKFVLACLATLAVATHSVSAQAWDGWDDSDASITDGAQFMVTASKLNVRKCAPTDGQMCDSIGRLDRLSWHDLTGKHKTVDEQQWLEIKYRLPFDQGAKWAPTAWVARGPKDNKSSYLLIEPESDGFMWKSCVVDERETFIREAPSVDAKQVEGGRMSPDWLERFVIVHQQREVDSDGRTWFPIGRKWCGDDCFTNQGWVTDQNDVGQTFPNFKCEGDAGYDSDKYAPVEYFQVDMNTLLSHGKKMEEVAKGR